MKNIDNQPAYNSGFPNPAQDASDLPLDLNRLVIKNPASTFYMRAGGNFDEELGIYSGDILVIDRAARLRSNDIIVAVEDGELKLARASKLKRATETTVWGVITHIIHKTRK